MYPGSYPGSYPGVDVPTQATDGLRVFVDWDKSGDFTAYEDDVTSLVNRAASSVSVSYGRDQSTALAPTISGSGSFVLDNRDRRFSPRNPASPLLGNLKPARPVAITRGIGSHTYTLFVGHTDDSPINPDPNTRLLSLALVDYLADLRGQTISTQLHQGIRTGEAIGLILDAVGWPTADRDLDGGATVIPWWWEDNTDALTAIEKVIRSEGPPAMLTVGSDGEIIFRDRHHRFTRSGSVTSQGTWRDRGTIEPVMHRDNFTYDEAPRNIINAASVSVDVRSPQALQQVWASDSTLTLSAGEQQIVTVTASDPFLGAVVPAVGTDYTLSSGSVTVRLLTTSGISTGIELTAGGSGAVITGLQLRAQPVQVAHTVKVSAEDVDSIAEYGRRNFPEDLPWCGVEDARAIAETAVALRSHPLPIVTARFQIHNNAAKAAMLLSRNLSDRVTVIEPETFTDGDFYIESIQHEIASDYDHAVLFGLEAVPPEMEAPADTAFRFDTAGKGFDDGTFGSGLTLSSTVFRFDTAGQGFDTGGFAY